MSDDQKNYLSANWPKSEGDLDRLKKVAAANQAEAVAKAKALAQQRKEERESNKSERLPGKNAKRRSLGKSVEKADPDNKTTQNHKGSPKGFGRDSHGH